ncbi:MAG: M23 family metallopeptidase [Nanoarchaeota archaeon]|nr:M23 family metallopeptidase [Nanoarchaeota archaeon]
MNQKNLKEITKETRVWSPNLDIALPIETASIPRFKKWVNWNGFSDKHHAYDFAAYMNDKNECVFGLPEETKVRAVADGVVTGYLDKSDLLNLLGEYDNYMATITIEHGKEGNGLSSVYTHINPLVKKGQHVKKGDVIATGYKDGGYKGVGRLVHLHFEMRNSCNIKDGIVNPATFFPQIDRYRATPQGSPEFQILGLSEQPEIYTAHFKKVLVNNS